MLTSQPGRLDLLFEELEVEHGASAHHIVERASVLLGLDIEIEVLDEAEWAAVPRYALADGDSARIAVRMADPRWYQLHVVVHELAHLLCGHSRCAWVPMTFDQLKKPADRPAHEDEMDAYPCREQSELQEREAEAQAHAIAHRLSALVRPPSSSLGEAL